MSYTSGDAAPTPHHAKLADSKWRYLNSWWVMLPLLSLGFLSWLGFLIAAARSGRWTFWASSALYAGLLVLATVLNSMDREGTGGTIAVLVLLLGCWVGASIHAAVSNRGFLRTLAAKTDWYDAPGAQLAQPQAEAAPFLGVAQSEYYAAAAQPYSAVPTMPPPDYPPPPVAPPAAPPAGSGRVDVNTATPGALRAIPGVEEGLAQRIVAIRDARGGFRDLDDLTAAANLQPHELVRLRDRLAFGATRPEDSGRHPGGAGRILDI